MVGVPMKIMKNNKFQLLFALIVLLYTCTWVGGDYQMPDLKEQMEQTFTEVISATNCDQFFFGQSFPLPKTDQTELIQLCQTQQHLDYIGPVVYATLYSIHDKIPMYSADVLTLYPNCSGGERPDTKYWHRVSLGMCNLIDGNLPRFPISSRLGIADEQILDQCRKFQATAHDYQGNWKLHGVDRGHLNPNSINAQDQESQYGTFTLTNAAPQFSKFNQNSWRQYECMTRVVILENVPMERVYIFTGTWGVAKDENNNPLWLNAGSGDGKNLVKVPGYYWKAVCYPGNPWTNAEPWSYVIMRENTKNNSDSTPEDFMSVKEFSATYFDDDLFHERCLKASMGPVVNYFDNWVEHVNEKCPGYQNDKKASQDDPKDEL